MTMNKKVITLILSILCVIVGFLHIPILNWLGVPVFKLRGMLIWTTLPIVGISGIPLAIWSHTYKSKSEITHKDINQ